MGNFLLKGVIYKFYYLIIYNYEIRLKINSTCNASIDWGI